MKLVRESLYNFQKTGDVKSGLKIGTKPCSECGTPIDFNDPDLCPECEDEWDRRYWERMESEENERQENLSDLYRYDDGGFSDGFTRY